MDATNQNQQRKTVLRGPSGDLAGGAPPSRGFPARVRFGAVCVAGALGLLAYAAGQGPDPKPPPAAAGPLGPAAALRGTAYLDKTHRLALHWNNGDFELWDTQRGQRLGPIERLPRPVGWCVASPDQATLLTGDRLPDVLNNHQDLKAQVNGTFVATMTVWDAPSGARKHALRVPEAAGHPYYLHEWYAQWLDNTRVLVVRLLRQNPARAASRLRLLVVDAAAGKVVQTSDELEWVGEHLTLSPDRKLAVLQDDNYVRRKKGGPGLESLSRNITARTHVLDVERLTVVAAWREPGDPKGPGPQDSYALLARWCPDGKTIVTVDRNSSEGGPAPRVRRWDARRGQLLQTFAGHTNHILDVAFTAAGDRLLTASEDRTVRVWDTGTGQAAAVLAGHAAGLNQVVVLPGDKLAVSAAEEPVAKVWDLATGKLKFDLAGHDAAVREVAAVSDTVVRTVTLRGTATTWDCATGKRLEVSPRPPEFPKRFGACELVEEKGTLHLRVRKN